MSHEAKQQAFSLLVVSDVRILREGIASSLGREMDLIVVEASTSGPEGLRRIFETAPAVIIVDTASGADLTFIAAVRQHLPRAKLVAFGIREDEDEIIAYAEAGYDAYVNRDATFVELAAVVRLTQRNELVCSSRIAATLFKRLSRATLLPTTPADALTLRERQVLGLIREGLANKEIASRLGISCATVKNHVHHVLEKLHVNRRAHAARLE